MGGEGSWRGRVTGWRTGVGSLFTDLPFFCAKVTIYQFSEFTCVVVRDDETPSPPWPCPTRRRRASGYRKGDKVAVGHLGCRRRAGSSALWRRRAGRRTVRGALLFEFGCSTAGVSLALTCVVRRPQVFVCVLSAAAGRCSGLCWRREASGRHEYARVREVIRMVSGANVS